MIQLYKSHSLTTLADALVQNLSEAGPPDPLQPVTMMVPNQDSARWLRLFLARKTGMAANIRYLLPSEWIWNVIRKTFPDLPEKLASDLDPIKWALTDEFLGSERMEGLQRIDRYLQMQPEARKEKAALQLAANIAYVFDAYLFYRPEMMTEWQKNAPRRGDAAWQARLWKKLLKRWDLLHSDAPWSQNKAELFEQAMASDDLFLKKESPLRVFHPGLIPSPVLQMLKKAGEACDVEIYQLQPSVEMDGNHHPLFTSFGREAVRVHALYQQVADETIRLFEPTPSEDTLLGSIQLEILENRPVARRDELKSCSSVQIRSCHSPLREVEVLHDFLLARFEADDSLMPGEILVATPEPEQYLPYVEAVFGVEDGSLPRIPVHVGNPGTPSPSARAFTELLEIANSSFEREDVMALLRSEPVRTALDLSESECDMIERWVEDNQVLWGLDYGEGLPPGSPRKNSWDEMMERGWMGQLLGETDPLDSGPLVYGGVRDRSRQEVWASLAAFLRKLHTFRSGTKEKRQLGQWCTWIRHQIGDLLGREFLTDRKAAGILSTLTHLEEAGRLGGSRTPISYDQFRTEVAEALKEHHAAGAQFTRGVVFSSMVPVRGIPFRIIALLGLNDHSFPRKSRTPDFDLMVQDPRPGERNRKEEDRNLFLQSILSASEVHYSSYIGQSKVDNEEIPPSVILRQWADYLSDVRGIPSGQLIAKETLTGFSENKYKLPFRSLSEVYEKTAARVLALGEKMSGLTGRVESVQFPPQAGTLTGSDGPGIFTGEGDVLSSGYDAEAAAGGSAQVPGVPPSAHSGREGSEEIQGDHTLRLEELTSFVKSPISWFFQNRFHVRLSDFYHENDEFTLDGLKSHLLYSRALEWKLAGVSDAQVVRLFRESGSIPYGWPGERQVKGILGEIAKVEQLFKKQGWIARRQSREVDITVGEWRIRGSVASEAADILLDLYPSSFKGKNILQSWVRYLAYGLAGGEWKSGFVLTDLRNAKVSLFTFQEPEEPEKLLAELISLYHHGQDTPRLWMPDTVTAGLMAREGREFAESRKAFEGERGRGGERDQEEVQLVLGSGAPWSKKLLAGPFADWVGQMVKHLEKDHV